MYKIEQLYRKMPNCDRKLRQVLQKSKLSWAEFWRMSRNICQKSGEGGGGNFRQGEHIQIQEDIT